VGRHKLERFQKKVSILALYKSNRSGSRVHTGESGDVSGETVFSCKERLPEIVTGYTEDILNLDKTGVFFKALPDRGFSVKGKECKGGKKSKQHITIVKKRSL